MMRTASALLFMAELWLPKRIEISMEFYSLKAAGDFAKKLEDSPEFDSDKFEIIIEHVSTNPDMYEVVILPALKLKQKSKETK